MSKTSNITNSYNEGEKCNLTIRGYEKVLKYSTLFNNSNLEFFVENEEKMPIGYNDVGDIVMLAT